MNGDYRITDDIGGAYLGQRTASGRRVLMLPTGAGKAPLDRSAGDLFLSFRSLVHFDLGPQSFDCSAAIIECGNADLLPTFELLASDLVEALTPQLERPSPSDVSKALAKWEELLRSRRLLTAEEQIGLWGELWLMSQIPDPDRAVACWQGPDESAIDFVGGGIGIECKASRRRLQHHVSQTQLERPLGDLQVYLLSIWVDEDQMTGETLADLVEGVDRRLAHRAPFETKLLRAGYNRADAIRYAMKLRPLEQPVLFPIESVPRVRQADTGVSAIRFEVTLSDEAAIRSSRCLETYAMLVCG